MGVVQSLSADIKAGYLVSFEEVVRHKEHAPITRTNKQYGQQHAYLTAGQAHEQAKALNAEIAAKEALLRAKASSYAAVCGGLLQIAKQGISAQYGRYKDKCTEKGRPIGKT